MIEINDFSVKTRKGKVLLKNISLKLERGHTIGLTGESGSGKSTLLKFILGGLDRSYIVTGGEIFVDNKDMGSLKPAQKRELCGKTIGYIPQNPMTAFDQRIKIGKQAEETLCVRLGVTKNTAINIFMEALRKFNLGDAERIVESYPSEISGGMLQRIAVALVFSLKPKYVLADEPTSALDEENRDILIEILRSKQKEIGILFVSHDVNALSSLCENVFVMGEGKIIEDGRMDDLLINPQNAWTKTFSKVYKNVEEGSFAWMKY